MDNWYIHCGGKDLNGFSYEQIVDIQEQLRQATAAGTGVFIAEPIWPTDNYPKTVVYWTPGTPIVFLKY
ncbi:hypothetical protein [Bifidobacterium sp. ESL0745]|uniref:hypothetical protein n=1 Tax=Bifidobacterium sp. ESL0745 TaxID=2983226 RepID=UPI0023F91349|nr:hypothetical protein [Bifidobacterium sp. ESL0745]MDF7665389.1 hypothetical protein [Bifidobacterium sp. ESL0745]